ncbi:MAG: hypothetical protein KC776_18525 [Myxococcales bacterium]|nr:hypothetical protein [Myxococcales bacterium]MCB9580243.1 hypothetical protein [Polyangiaceae bacterium]
MSAVKVSVSLDSEDLAWLRKQAKRRKKSLSAVLTESVRRARREGALDEVLIWLDAPKLTLHQLEEYRKLWDVG